MGIVVRKWFTRESETTFPGGVSGSRRPKLGFGARRPAPGGPPSAPARGRPPAQMCPASAAGRARARGKRNICSQLSRRAQGFFTNDAGMVQRTNLGILRKLVCQKSTKFKNVWTTHSKSPIAYERGRIYFDNYRCCVSSVAAEPRKRYEMPKCSKSEKIEDALLWECPVGDILPNPSDYRSSLIALTAHNWLLRISANNGEVLEKVYLASYCKFRYLNWDTPQEVIVVKSAQSKATALARQAGIQPSVLLYFAVFRVIPLSLIGMLEINKKIFGSGVTDATISHGMLIVMHNSGLIRLYSFQAITEQFMQQKLDLGRTCRWGGTSGTVGESPFGIPCNIKITDTPPLLFEVSSLENTFQIGGYPWHYIITPNKKKQKGVFHICALKDHTMAKNGIQEMNCCSLESDWIYFHPDASGRIIHVGPNQVKILKLKEIENSKTQHQVVEDFVIVADREEKTKSLLTVTASGRVVKKRLNLLDDDPEQETFKIVDYEDELDLLSVVAVTQLDTEGKAHLDFHCNEHGTLLKSIPLVESWDVTYSHEVYFDRDLVLHIEQKPNRVFSCYVYQMMQLIGYALHNGSSFYFRC
ncbi:DDB1- and CUL4-associated factor 17 isoform X5 [Sarcophilus harrisii]|uniref:DDB1- and CUL4-associated factor 17 isoform X5 n=1 Tax=Sarcophilus harrisii TaxID=9305 RepID=UPI001301A96B|nr:DDB1- and CUL4-associated factor 17 isoform X5 [Sarcophilus harrisii]XP_031816331.1 DDB1- and CUL4-associated factor 17 isoform X5 [Sarcophilus harrisii]